MVSHFVDKKTEGQKDGMPHPLDRTLTLSPDSRLGRLGELSSADEIPCNTPGTAAWGFKGLPRPRGYGLGLWGSWRPLRPRIPDLEVFLGFTGGVLVPP